MKCKSGSFNSYYGNIQNILQPVYPNYIPQYLWSPSFHHYTLSIKPHWDTIFKIFLNKLSTDHKTSYIYNCLHSNIFWVLVMMRLELEIITILKNKTTADFVLGNIPEYNISVVWSNLFILCTVLIKLYFSLLYCFLPFFIFFTH